MSDKMEADQNGNESQEAPRERVGEALKKERISRRVTVETIAKDLKLNVRYINALEENDYGSLPADPYVRVYLRSLAKYLSLDPDEILKKFYDERGLGSDLYKKDSSTKIEINVKERAAAQKNPRLLIALCLIVLLFGFMFVANKRGWIPSSSPSVNGSDSSQTSPAQSKKHDSTTLAKKAVRDSLIDDSLYSGAPVQRPGDSAEGKSTAAKVAKTVPVTKDSGSIHLKIVAVKDSVTVEVFTDGKLFKTVVPKKADKTFDAHDSINCGIETPENVKYMFNEKPFTVRKTPMGQVYFKLDSTGTPVRWTSKRWNEVFKERLK